MKNFIVIDGARNSTHDIFGVDEKTFEFVFPDDTDIAFLDEVEKRVRENGMDEESFFNKLYSNQMDKKSIIGLHGTLHSTGSYCEKNYFPSRKETDVKNKANK